MPRKASNLNSLARGRVRASMNKFNLFNLYKKPAVRYQGQTIFQQKWKAKQETRAYHGEHLTEGRWKEIFNPKLESVAQLDASLKGLNVKETPLPLQTYASLEKRLETAVFRSMFASSVRQARQFILGGHVKVNGVTIKHPSFPLKAGDIFNVKPEKVLLAMGKNKPSLEKAIKIDNKQIAAWNKYVRTAKEHPKDVWDLKQSKPASLDTLREKSTKSVKSYNDKLDEEMKSKQNKTTRQSVLSKIINFAKDKTDLTSESFEGLYGKGNSQKCYNVYSKLANAKHELLQNGNEEECAKAISKKSNEYKSESDFKVVAGVKKALSEIVSDQLEFLRVQAQRNKLPESATNVPFTQSYADDLTYHQKLEKEVEDESKVVVKLPWQKGLFGRQDPSKHYFTPWTPRPFLGAFAILPSHIEISFSTCHAVYMRDPVARPGYSEVISPLPTHIHERAYMYYARKGL